MSGNRPDLVMPTFCECGDHAFAPLTRGYVTLVSPQDAGLLTRKWVASVTPRAVQVRRSDFDAQGIRRSVLLSRKIMRPQPGRWVDHINCDPTDNRRSNMRLCSPAENCLNRRPERGAAVPFKGVHRLPSGRYRAAICKDGHKQYLGVWDTPELAAAAYREAASVLHGEYARAS